MHAAALPADHAILRQLARRRRELALRPEQAARRALWTAVNDLRPARPAVIAFQIPWHELEEAEPAALRPRCADPWLRQVETGLRRELYQAERFAGDLLIEPVLAVDVVGGPTSVYADYGLQAREVRRDGAHDVQFEPVINGPDDVARIARPRVWIDQAETRRRRDRLAEAVGDAIPVEVRGLATQWHTPWDMAVRWYGVERLMTDLIDRPELVAAVCERMCAIAGEVLDEQERIGLLAPGGGGELVGSGGYGCTTALPAAGPMPRRQWGCGNAQIFSEVSPRMHEEFSLRFERPFLERFGLSYYGCCEPLHRKLAMLRSVRNLRKVSMSPRAVLREGAAACARDYVVSWKPNPADLAFNAFDAAHVRAGIRQAVDDMRGCNAEIILKDLTTVRGDAARLSAWMRIAMEEVGV